MRTTYSLPIALALAATVSAQTPPSGTEATQLPVTRVALYKNGVGFFEHSGHVVGSQPVTIDFTTAQLNDVLQSLTAIDLNGGKIAGAGYNSTTPLEQQLKSLPLALGMNPTGVDFYNAIRGARVEVHVAAATIAGRLLNIEVVNTPAGGGAPATQKRLITVIGDAGEVRTLELTPATQLRLLDADLHQDVTRYLQLLASTRNQGLRHLTLQDNAPANGTGPRSIVVSYISEVPIWKSTYRILFTESKTKSSAPQTATLQGWSVVDNTTGSDWNDVQLSLIAGAPQSFIQPLSQPLYSRRPEIPIALEAQTTPQTHESGEFIGGKPGIGQGNGSGLGAGVGGNYGGGVAGGNGSIRGTVTDPSGAVIANAQVVATNTQTGVQTRRATNASGDYVIQLPAGRYTVEVTAPGFQRLMQQNVALSNLQALGLNPRLNVGSASSTVTVTAEAPMLDTESASIGGFMQNRTYTNLPLSAPPPSVMYDTMAQTSISPNTTTAAFDDYFAYNITEPITIRKNESALVPILQTKIDAERVTLWSSQQPTPLRALWIKNTSDLTLDRGSFSIVEDGNFGGEGLLDPIHPAEKRLLSYAVDQAVRVTTVSPSSSSRVTSITVSKGVMVVRSSEVSEITYMVHNAAPEARMVVVEHPVRNGFTLDSASGTASTDPKPAETTPAVYRFRVAAEPGESVGLHIGERFPGAATYQLTNSADNTLTYVLTQTGHNPALEAALQPIFAARRHQAEMQAALDKIEARINGLRSDEDRQRSNVTALASADKASRDRFVHDLNATEDKIAAATKEQATAEAALQTAQDDLDDKIEAIQLDEKL